MIRRHEKVRIVWVPRSELWRASLGAEFAYGPTPLIACERLVRNIDYETRRGKVA